jgi:Flp pilus assembly protein TadG
MMIAPYKPLHTTKVRGEAWQCQCHNLARGAVIVEFALLLLPLLLMVFGVAEYGRALYQYNSLVKSVRDSARYIAQHNPNDASAYPVALDNARCLAVHGNTGCSGPALLPGLATSMVSIASASVTTAAGTPIALVEVTITGYSFAFVFNPLRLVGNSANTLLFGDIRATMRQV